MTRLTDLFPLAELEQRIDAGLVSRKEHHQEPLAILNYTHRCQYGRAWDDVTRQTRGLIYRTDTLDLVARPWPKFFNHGEPSAPTLDLAEPVEVTDKLDGSLGILYPWRDGHGVATRGSFASDQALHATEVWLERYAGRFTPYVRLTYLFEIVYPANRVVCDYGDTDDLFLLGVVDTETGRAHGPAGIDWPGPRAHTFSYRTLAEAVAADPRPNAEGLVVHLLERGQLVKVKQADYVELHRLVTGLNERVVWEQLGAGVTVDALCEPLPDEFHGWVRDIADRLAARRDGILEAARTAHEEILATRPADRKAYAAQATRMGWLTPLLFTLLDGKDPAPAVWRTLRPSGANTLVAVSEDAA